MSLGSVSHFVQASVHVGTTNLPPSGSSYESQYAQSYHHCRHGRRAQSSAALSQPAPSKPPTEQAKPSFALPPESITVTGIKPSEKTIEDFVKARGAPTRFLGKLARWRRGIRPLTIGLGDKYATFVTQRIREIALAVGAPVSADPNCKTNIEVVFTTKPQEFMDNVRKSGPAFLGYYATYSQADELAKVTNPIQAWYTTESLDNNWKSPGRYRKVRRHDDEHTAPGGEPKFSLQGTRVHHVEFDLLTRHGMEWFPAGQSF